VKMSASRFASSAFVNLTTSPAYTRDEAESWPDAVTGSYSVVYETCAVSEPLAENAIAGTPSFAASVAAPLPGQHQRRLL
jgi:hypothetical protein